MDLLYRDVPRLHDLAIGECTVRAARSGPLSWWQFWTLVRRTDNDELLYVVVPVLVGGVHTEAGPIGKRMWGLTREDASTWVIAPSIDVVGDERPDGSRAPSLWHQNARLVGVPQDARWISDPP